MTQRRFILLDHSIIDQTGHYLEYAKRVLLAARRSGFETILAVNRRATATCVEADSVHAEFSRTYWEYQRLRVWDYIVASFNNGYFSNAQRNASMCYSQELRALFNNIGIRNDDIIFVPTLGGVELVGIAHYVAPLNKRERQWHLLFRRDLLIPGSVFDLRTATARSCMVGAFNAAKRTLSNLVWFLYTDTEELTLEYNSQKIGEFSTLPIPTDQSARKKQKLEDSPLCIALLGGARIEKGIHLMPGLIRAVRAGGFGTDVVKFVIQGNIASELKTAETRKIRRVLEEIKGLGCEVLGCALDSISYQDALSASDILMFPYDKDSYRARSSGIFAEALAAGVPTVVPMDSWMARAGCGFAVTVYSDIEDMYQKVIKLICEYLKYKEQSMAVASRWKRIHNADNLINKLLRRI